eukprot:PITA_06026
MVSTINNAPKGYKSPKYDKARTVGLDHEKEKISHSLNRMTSSWIYHGVSIVSNGWTNVKGKPLINVLAVSVSGAIFLSAYDYPDKFKTGINIAEPLLETIECIGPYNAIQVITDNAPNCKVAGAIIKDKYPNIFWSGCLVHTMNLLMHDIVKNRNNQYKWLGDLYKRGKQMIKFITNHNNTHGLFRSHSRLELLKIARIRFGRYYLTFRCLLKVEEAALDGMFWAHVRQVLDFTKPIYHMIQFADTDKPVIGEVYEQMDTMLGQINDIVHNNDLNLYKLIHNCVCIRWDKLNVPLYCLAYILAPKYYSTSWLGQPAPQGGVRVKHHIYEEVSIGYLQALEKLILDREECASVHLELGRYFNCTGLFGTFHAMEDRDRFDALTWCESYGSHGLLPKLAKESLTESLVYVHYNLRLLSHYCDRAYEYPTYKIWDNHPEDDNLEDGIIHLEELEVELMSEEDEATTMPPPPSSSTARVQSLVPLLSPPPSTLSHGGHVPSGSGCRSMRQETPRRPPQRAYTSDASRGKGHMK